MKQTPNFHPNAPKRLINLWKNYPAYYRIAKYLNVNPATVWKALRKGEEPINENVRQKFGLPRKPRKPHPVGATKPIIPQYLKWWRGLDHEIRDMYIKETFDTWSTKRP
jgi:hypothetical protein